MPLLEDLYDALLKQPEPEADVSPQETDEVQNQPIEASEESKETEQVERSPES